MEASVRGFKRDDRKKLDRHREQALFLAPHSGESGVCDGGANMHFVDAGQKGSSFQTAHISMRLEAFTQLEVAADLTYFDASHLIPQKRPEKSVDATRHCNSWMSICRLAEAQWRCALHFTKPVVVMTNCVLGVESCEIPFDRFTQLLTNA